MRFKMTSELEKIERRIIFTKSQIDGWETFYTQVRDPNNILVAKNEIAINSKILSELEGRRKNLSSTNTQNP